MRYVVGPEDSSSFDRLGGKAAALAALARAGFSIPAWFVLAPEACDASLGEQRRRALDSAGGGGTGTALLQDVQLDAEVYGQLASAMATLCPNGERVAVRSSACDEDGAGHSFAGQLDSFLFARQREVPGRVVEVWRSAFGDRAVAYRRERGLDSIPRPPAVLIQRMVNAERSGVAFGADPVSGRRDVAVVTAVYGLGTALVSGEGDADAYRVDRDGRILSREIADKRVAHRHDPRGSEGIRTVEVPDEIAGKPVLDDDQVRAVAELARRAGRHFGRPQDIEWAIQEGRLYLLQSRPITSLSTMADPGGVRRVWDNSNIAESYGGVTTPLTFSFARRAYEGVYRRFCHFMRVPRRRIAAHDDIFGRMLGLIRGRVYYNLLNWYRLLAMLPGFTVNRRFMEQMMGVSEGLPESVLAECVRPTWRARLLDGLGLARCIGTLVVHHFLLPHRIGRFHRRLDRALGSWRSGLGDLRPDELVAHYRDLERELLSRWDAPLINDFFTMVFFGVLRRLTQQWCGDRDGTLQNDLLCGDGDLISAEPAKRLREMAGIAVQDPALVTRLCDGSVESIQRAMARVPDLAGRFRDYVARFGDRCPGELKLESPTLHDDPLPLLRSVGQLARRMRDGDAAPAGADDWEVRRRAERRVRGALGARPLQRAVFSWVLRHARARIRDRENLRFERTRVFGHVRRLAVEIGKRLHALDLLDGPRDVFYLEVEEVLGFVDGACTTADLRGLVALRKKEYDGYRASEAPPDRFETRGIVYQRANLLTASVALDATSGDCRKGTGCCPGVARGPARVVSDPWDAALLKGEILVAERTDPGWVMLFPSAAGLLVERGSLLSHSAIVARELGIPSIVSIPGLTAWLKDGDWVELDGSSGVVRRVEPAGQEAGRAA